MSSIIPSAAFLAKTFKKLHEKEFTQIRRPTLNDGKENWNQVVSAEVLKLVLDRMKVFNSNNMLKIDENDILRLFDKIMKLYGLKIKIKN